MLHERDDTVKEFEKATLAWATSPAGPESQKSLQERRSMLAATLRAGYWQLDPYIRARTLYDRTGIIGEGGIVNFYGNTPRTDPTKPPSPAAAPRIETSADDVD